jgi:transposase-like protein
VELLEQGERSAVQLSQELGVSDCSLGKWKRQYGRQGRVALNGLEAAQSRIEELEREVAAVSRQRDIFKKSLSHLGPGTHQLYEMTEALHCAPDCYGRTELCRAFGVSRSGLYEHALKARHRLKEDRYQVTTQRHGKISPEHFPDVTVDLDELF